MTNVINSFIKFTVREVSVFLAVIMNAGRAIPNTFISETLRGVSGKSRKKKSDKSVIYITKKFFVINNLPTYLTVFTILFPSSKILGSNENLFFNNTISATSLVILLPSSIAIPISASFIAGRSLTPSPIIAV